MRWDVINHLIEKNNYKTYLEIGYYKGWSFDNIKCYNKTAVDPHPCKEPYQEQLKYGEIDHSWSIDEAGVPELNYDYRVVKLTSDDFFSKLGEKKSELKWDVIFIDGLHEWKQVLKDVENSLKYLSPGGSIVLHDCNPPKAEHTTTGVDGCWTGDVYKAVIKYAQDPNFDFYTVDIDWGVGVLQKHTGMKLNGRTSVQKYVDDWNEFDRDREYLLNLISYPDFIRKIKDVKPRNETAKDNNSSAE